MAVTAAGPSAAPDPVSPDPVSPEGLGSPAWGGFDHRRTRDPGPVAAWRGFRTAVSLGWQMEANWTDPLLFFIYSVAKPVSAALILVVMLEIISGGGNPGYLAFVVVGTALWAYVYSGIAGVAWSILDDRERYRMLKYIYVSPNDFLTFLLGRGVARVAVGAMGTIITLGVGVVALGVRFDAGAVDWPLLVLVMILGTVAIVAVGVLIGAVCLQTRQESWSYPDAVAGALFLISGVVFPLSVLPSPLQAIGMLTPLTWWLEGIRHAVFPAGASGVGGAGSLWTSWVGSVSPDTTTIVVALLATGGLVTLAATGIFRLSERRAKDRGLLDRTTGS